MRKRNFYVSAVRKNFVKIAAKYLYYLNSSQVKDQLLNLKKILSLLVISLLSFNSLAEEYDATVTTDSGSYNVPVEVENNEVTVVHWLNGVNMNVYNAELDPSGCASGSNYEGDKINIEIQNSESEDTEEQ